jgi:hypothetical protein
MDADSPAAETAASAMGVTQREGSETRKMLGLRFRSSALGHSRRPTPLARLCSVRLRDLRDQMSGLFSAEHG